MPVSEREQRKKDLAVRSSPLEGASIAMLEGRSAASPVCISGYVIPGQSVEWITVTYIGKVVNNSRIWKISIAVGSVLSRRNDVNSRENRNVWIVIVSSDK